MVISISLSSQHHSAREMGAFVITQRFHLIGETSAFWTFARRFRVIVWVYAFAVMFDWTDVLAGPITVGAFADHFFPHV
jgi:hypothetical protein